jgi:8-oxo-dGTP diphosphatase
MKKVAKLVIVDSDDKYLMMYRSNHPTFGVDPDLPGGTLEDGETMLETMLREVKEEAGVDIDQNSAKEIYSGTNYSVHGTHYALFIAKLNMRPTIAMSWEHSSYEWLDRDEFVSKSINAKDTFMHMVADMLKQQAVSS